MIQQDNPLLSGLNNEQREAVTTTEGPMLIIAGPGSGKTRVIIQRIAHLIQDRQVRPERILAVTFTNKAAAEMTHRLSLTVEPDAAKAAHVSTFHKFCGLMNRIYSHTIGLNGQYSIYDHEDQLTVVKRAMELANIPTGRDGIRPRDVLDKISLAKSRLMTPEQYRQWIFEDEEADLDYSAEAAADVYPLYERDLKMANCLDFDDMINRTVRILRESDQTRERTHRRLRYVMVDEYQDTNHAQNELTRLLTGPHQNLCVVGDPDQSIYGWRNADIRNIIAFTDHYPNSTIVRMGRNYRSTETIVAAATELISRNQTRLDNPLTAVAGPGFSIQFAAPYTTEEEAEWTIERMQELVTTGECAWRDCAVMYRINAQSRPFEEVCIQRRVPYRLIGGTRFYERREIKDALAYLKIILNPGDTVSLQRVINTPPRKIGAATVNRLLQFADQHSQTLMQSVASVASAALAQDRPKLNRTAIQAVGEFHVMASQLREKQDQMTLAELFDAVMDATGLEQHVKADDDGNDRWDNVLELRSLTEQDPYPAQTAERSLPNFLERVSLVQDIDQYDDAAGVLTLINLHQSKGLEFYAVAMPGVSEGTLPLAANDPEEERRLCYVGITRAKRRLFMSCPEIIHRYGHRSPAQLSRFLHEIPDRYFAPAQ